MENSLLIQLLLIILFLPVVSFLIIIFNQKRLGKSAAAIGSAVLGIDLLLSLVVAYSKLFEHAHSGMIQTKVTWLELANRQIELGIGIDNLAAIMLIVVNLISFLVHIFSTVYMHGDKRFPRFYAYLSLFTFSMLGIVLANNFLNMYIFWELVGISSYLLIGFWYEKDSASNAGKKAFIMNRVGDLGFFAGIMIIFFTYGTFMFDEVFNQISEGVIPFESGVILTVMGIFIFMGAIGKSAQFPLHTWLPDAMEGPTPVSALIHAATMVAAGVYLTAKVFPIFSADALLFIAYTGAITAFLAATIAITQNDFKKVLAYSTVSQLGYMIMAIGIGAFTTGFFHLVTHAWFKACLFLASGSVIHAMHESMHRAHNHSMDAQDIRNMGGLKKTMPWTYATFLLATLAISGVPFTSGFLSKDGILAGTLAFGQLSGHWFIPLAGFGAALMTAFYMFRLTIVSFHKNHKTDIAKDTKENGFPILMPLIVLSTLSLFIFYSYNPFNSSGWFTDRVQAPETAVPAQYQWDFLVPHSNHSENLVSNEIFATDLAHEDHNNEHSHPHKEEEHKTDENSHSHDNHSHSGEDTHSHDNHSHADEHDAHGHHHSMHEFDEEMHHAHMPAMIMSLIIAGIGILLAFIMYQFGLINPDTIANALKPLYNLSYNKWYIDEIYNFLFVNGTIVISKIFAWFDNTIVDGVVNLVAKITDMVGWFVGLFDNKIIDGLVNLIAWITGFIGIIFKKFQTGKIQTYLLLSVIALLILIFYFV